MDREPHMPMPRLVMVLSENWTLVDPRDLRGLVELAVVAEAAGIDAVMMSEHIVLGASAGANGIMTNPRDYAAPGNQDPAMPWPSSLLVLASAAQATTTLRLIAGAVIAPLRHPLLLAKELGTLDLLSEGRLVVLPTVSWHRDEYDALGVPYDERGRILDEQLEVLAASWGPGPIRYEGKYYAFDDVWLEPRGYRSEGPTMWFGGQGMHAPLLRRLVRYGHGFNPFGTVTDADLATLRAAMTDAGRPLSSLEMVGGIRGTFSDDHAPADLDTALQSLPGQLERGYTTICFKPAMFIDEATQLGGFCRELVRKVGEFAT